MYKEIYFAIETRIHRAQITGLCIILSTPREMNWK